MIIDSSLAIILFFGLLISVLLASHTFYRESTDGTLVLLLTKPVPRYIFVIAKITGILLTLSFFIITCSIATINSLTISVSQFESNYYNMFIFYFALALAALWGGLRNYFGKKVFTESATFATAFFLILQLLQNLVLPIGSLSAKTAQYQINLIPALILLLFAIWIMGALTVVFATRFNLIVNMLLTLPVYILGLMSNYLFYNHIHNSIICSFLYTIIPNWQFFWMADAISSDVSIPLNYIFWAFIYTLLYIVFAGVIAVVLFKNKELGKDRL